MPTFVIVQENAERHVIHINYFYIHLFVHVLMVTKLKLLRHAIEMYVAA